MRVVADILLRGGCGAGHVLTGNGLDLFRLLVDYLSSLGHVVVNGFLVRLVDQRGQEEDRGGNERESPERHKFDEVVCEKGGHKCLSQLVHEQDVWRDSTHDTRNQGILDKDDALRLNDEEVDELVHITQTGIERLLGNGKVLARAELRRQTDGQQCLTGNLCKHGNSQDITRALECITEQVQVAHAKDKRHHDGIGNARRTRVLPRQQIGEEGVVVGERLARSRSARRCRTRGSQIREFR